MTALRMGLSLADLHSLPFTTVLMLVREYAGLSSPDGGGGARRATQKDIDAVFG